MKGCQEKADQQFHLQQDMKKQDWIITMKDLWEIIWKFLTRRIWKEGMDCSGKLQNHLKGTISRKVRHLCWVVGIHLPFSQQMNGNPFQSSGPPSLLPPLCHGPCWPVVSQPGLLQVGQPGVSGLDLKSVQKNFKSWKISSLFYVLIKGQLMHFPCHSRQHCVDRICLPDLLPFLSQN